MRKILPIIVAGFMILIGFGAVGFDIDFEPLTFLDELDQYQEIMTEDLGVPIGHVAIPDNPISIQLAQSFIPTKGILSQVELFIGKNSTTTYPLEIAIREELTEDDLTSISIEPGDVPTEDYDWVEIDFDDINVNTGHTYYIVTLTENVTDNFYMWGGNNLSESYPDGCMWHSLDEGNTWGNESAASDSSEVVMYANQGKNPRFEENITWDMCFRTYGRENSPPETPTIEGPTNGNAGTQYDYDLCSSDPDGDDIYYCIDWDDGSGEICIGPYPSGVCTIVSHTWDEQGTYAVKVKARDTHDAESDWATLSVTMPRNRAIKTLFLNFLQKNPHIFPILQQFFGLQ